MTWLDRNAVHFLKEMVAVGLDESAADTIRLDAIRWLLSRVMPKPRGAGQIRWNEKLPDYKGPKEQVVFTSTQGIHALQVSSATFYRHVRKLQMRPRKKYKSNARWWTYDDLLRLLNSVYSTVEERADMYFRMHEGKE